MKDILTEILEYKKREVLGRKTAVPLAELEQMPFPEIRNFRHALQKSGLSVIAEVKHKSPSAGVIQPDFDPVRIAMAYEQAGADAVSVLTDEKYFGGHLDYLKRIREATGLPLLCKDFIIDPYQILEARVSGADAVLLIVRALSGADLQDFIQIARALDLYSLVEVHSMDELGIALDADPEIIGVNNRNLGTFAVDIGTSLALKTRIPAHVTAVSESGIRKGSDTQQLRLAGFDAVLVGETLMREKNPAGMMHELKG
ncbi:indole-3-glycerol phosphate synthase TrpC [bacterium]|nr:indole-3-glycerol phosphate synthase TrpC [bacterium]